MGKRLSPSELMDEYVDAQWILDQAQGGHERRVATEQLETLRRFMDHEHAQLPALGTSWAMTYQAAELCDSVATGETVAEAERLEADGWPWPVSGDAIRLAGLWRGEAA